MEESSVLKALLHETEPDAHVLRNLVKNCDNLNEDLIVSLHNAVGKGFLNSVRILLEAGISPNTRSGGWNSRSPLHMCSVVKQHTAIVRELLNHGADVNAENWRKRTPLHESSTRQCVENVKELLKNGATVDAVDLDGETPLFRSMQCLSDVSMVQVLLSAGSDVNHRDKVGRTPLHNAVDYELPQVIRVLCRYNADANARDIFGDTPLHRAATRTPQKTIALIRELYKGGARLNELNNEGHSPLYCAIINSREEATVELLRSGASFDLFKGLNALVYAARRPPNRITIAHNLIRYVFIKNPDSLEKIRQQLMQKHVICVLRKLSPDCTLEDFQQACLTEVEVLSKSICDCGRSSIWGSINNCEECWCDTHQAILKFLFSEQPTNFTDAFFYKLSKEFLLEATVNLMTYFEFKESEKRFILPWVCRKEIERNVSFEDAVSFLQRHKSEMDTSEFEKFLAFMKGYSSVNSTGEITQKDFVS